ncbi:MAG: DUF2330 domain-containing protein [Myxococcota bacterium]|nr:DUF2330 domain-containing protein [Myxococcota bacterium]
MKRRPNHSAIHLALPSVLGQLLLTMACTVALNLPAHAALILSEHDQQVSVVREQSIIVYDALRATQTTLIRLEVRAATKPFSLFVPVQGKAKANFGHIRSFKNMLRQLHPVSNTTRNINLNVTSWVGGCVVPQVGLEPTDKDDGDTRSLKSTTHEFLKDESASRRWLMHRGVSLTPGQIAWMRGLRKRGWTFLGVDVTPPAAGDSTESFYTPIIAYTHPADHAAYNVHQPPPSLTGGTDKSQVPLELVILSEWPVGPEVEGPMELALSKPITAVQLERLKKRSRGFPWDYESDGHLTGYVLTKRDSYQVLRFTKMKVLPEKKPKAKRRERLIDLNIPIELIILGTWLTIWAWRGRSTRFKFSQPMKKLQ